MSIYGFLLEKYGKMRITTKDRLFILDGEYIKYYPKPQDKKINNILYDLRSKLRKGEVEFDGLERFRVGGEENEVVGGLKLKSQIPLSRLRIEPKQKDQRHVLLYDSDRDDSSSSAGRQKSPTEWEVFLEGNEMSALERVVEEVRNIKKSLNKASTKEDAKKPEETGNVKSSSQGTMFTDCKFLQKMEGIYQNIWTEYFKELAISNRKSSKLVELEFSIQIIMNEYRKYCERLCKVILSYMKMETFKEKNKTKILPILFPSLVQSDDQDNYLIYYFFGVTITVTWNVVTYNKKEVKQADQQSANMTQNLSNRKESKLNSSNIEEFDYTLLYGTWSTLKANFKSIDYYQNHPYENMGSKLRNQRVPLTCLIDYCGFRFLCESDLAGESKSSETQKAETKREIREDKGDSDFYNKAYEIFMDTFGCAVEKKEGNKDDILGMEGENEGNKGSQGQEKKAYEKFFDVVNDYFNTRENSKENVENSAGVQNKTLFFQEQKNKRHQQKRGGQGIMTNNNQNIEYYNISYNDFSKLIEHPGTNQQNEEIFFNNKVFFRQELLNFMNGNENSFGERKFAHEKNDNLENKNTNDSQKQMMLERMLREKYLNIFINSLDSFYYKLYDPEIMDNLFHAYGINLIFLGQIAEKAESPYLKEFCLNEMIARICKKIIFHLLAERRLEPFIAYIESNKDSMYTTFPSQNLPYKYQKLYLKYEIKTESKSGDKSDWSYFKHLKNIFLGIGAASSDTWQYYFNIWDNNQNNTLKNNDENVRNDILNIAAGDDKKSAKLNENEGHNANKRANSIIADDHIKDAKEIFVNFLNILFGRTKAKIRVKGKIMGTNGLWDFILKEMRSYFKVESKELLVFCKPSCMSIPPFLESLEYHTGFRLNWGTVLAGSDNAKETDRYYKDKDTSRDMSREGSLIISKKSDIDKKSDSRKIRLEGKNFYPENDNLFYTNRHLLNYTWKPEDVKEINPKTKTLSYSLFLSNENKYIEYISNFSQLIINRNRNTIEPIDKYMLIRYFYEKINRSNLFSLWYVSFFNELKGEELQREKEEASDSEDKVSKIDKVSDNEDKTNKANLVNRNLECIDIYKGIYRDLVDLTTSNKNTNFDLTNLLYERDSMNDDEMKEEDKRDSEEINLKRVNLPCVLYKKKFFILSYIMLNIAREISDLPEYSLIDKHTNNMDNYHKDGSSENYDYPQNGRSEHSNTNIENTVIIKIRESLPLRYEKQAKELIENFYYKTHPYMSDIKELIAKELLKKWKLAYKNKDELEDIIEMYFREAIENGLKCLSKNNLFLANIALDTGSYYSVRNNYLEAVKILNWAYIPFKQNYIDFQRDYYMFLKRYIKYNIKLGDYTRALLLGEELINENAPLFRNEKDNKAIEFLQKNFHYERIIYNLALVCLKTKEYERGLKYCQKIFMEKETNQITSSNVDNQTASSGVKKNKSEYISWMLGDGEKYSVKFNENDSRFNNRNYEQTMKDYEYHIKLKLYLKMIIRNLKDENKSAYIQALLRIYDSLEERREVKKLCTPPQTTREIRELLEGKGDLSEYFRAKILPVLKSKNKDDEQNSDKLQSSDKEKNTDYDTFRILIKYFEYRGESVFYNFYKKGDPRYHIADDVDMADKNNMEEDNVRSLVRNNKHMENMQINNNYNDEESTGNKVSSSEKEEEEED